MARPREFDADEALDKAMHLFWAKGYYDTSIRDLVEATGVNYYGLYGTFESKHGLFLAALDRYRAKVTSQIVRELNRPGGYAGKSRYLVEPNVKEGKGGLRDLHTLFWISKYHFRVRTQQEARSRSELLRSAERAVDVRGRA